MATRKLPPGFGKTLKALIAQGHKPKDAMREAWKLHKGTGPGMRKGALYNPRRKRELISSRDSFAYKRYLVKKTLHGWAISRGGYHIGWAKDPEDAKQKIDEIADPTEKNNPIAIYNPRRKKRARINPQPKWKMLYGDVIEIRAIKTTGEFRGQPFKHKFATRVLALGLPNGTVLLEAANRSRLWDYESNIG